MHFYHSLRQWLGIELVEVSAKEKLVAATGGGLAILILVCATSWMLPNQAALCVVASMGASAVLLFGVPHGQLSQPWPVIAGHGMSALIGVVCAHFIPYPSLAAACAVGLSIGAMVQFKCVHPPGGATAFTAVMGGAAIRKLGIGFVFFPVFTNALAMVLLAVVINYTFRWRRYPVALHHPRKPSLAPETVPSHEEVIAAVRSLDSFVDISEEDLLQLVELLKRPEAHPSPPCFRVRH